MLGAMSTPRPARPVTKARPTTLLDEIDFHRFMEVQSSRWGAAAARLLWKRKQWGHAAVAVAGTGILLALYGGFGHWPTALMTIALLVGGTMLACRAVHWHRTACAAVGVTLGMDRRVRRLPMKAGPYEKWCTAHRITPYSPRVQPPTSE